MIPTHIDDVANNLVNNTFANIGDSEEDIYPATVSQIAAEQRKDTNLRQYFKKDIEADLADSISLKVMTRPNCYYIKVHVWLSLRHYNQRLQRGIIIT